VSGAFGDLGTLLPLTLGVLAVGKLNATAVLGAFGLAYLLSALIYRAPVPVQPMKVATAVLVTTAAGPATAAGAALALAAVFLAAGATGLVERLARLIPTVVTAALQLGIAASLAWIALDYMARMPLLAAGLGLLLAYLVLRRPGWPAALVLLAAAALATPFHGPGGAWAFPGPAPSLPPLWWPGADDLARGAVDIALPQIPLTLTNAILVTAIIGRRCFPQARGLHERRLALTTGAVNVIAAPLGAIPICHGAGGVTAHHRFGASSWRAPATAGTALLALGIGWGSAAPALLGHIPPAALGVLLLLPALDLARAARPFDFGGRDRGLLTGGAVLALLSPGVAFVITLAAARLLRGSG
jgi:predicted benzoate:H+ symporter BenE